MEKSNFVSIDYNEYVRGDYKGVLIRDGLTATYVKFYSGKIEDDFRKAVNSVVYNSLSTICSSTIDNFLLDNKEDYTFDHKTFNIVRVTWR